MFSANAGAVGALEVAELGQQRFLPRFGFQRSNKRSAPGASLG